MGSLGITNILAAAAEFTTLPSLGIVVGPVLNFINGIIGNAGWAMVIFTVLLKLIVTPLDYISKRNMRKNALIQEKLKGQLEKLQAQCSGDQQLYNQKMMAIMKKEGYSMGGACLPLIVTLALFMAVFAGLRTYSTFENAKIYQQMIVCYNDYEAENTPPTDPDELDAYNEERSQYLISCYKKINPGWLWVKNMWSPDTNASAVPTYSEFTKGTTTINKIGNLPSNEHYSAERQYELVMGSAIDEYNNQGGIAGWNGLWILPVLAGAVSFLSQFITQKTQGQQTAQQQMAGGGGGFMKILTFVFPLLMVYFASMYSTCFTVYIITSNVMTLASTLITNAIVNKTFKLKRELDADVDYSRERL